MRKFQEGLSEESVLFVSVAKWFVLASAVGVLVGIGTAVFLRCLEWTTAWTNQYTYYFVALPLALFATAFLIEHLAPDAHGHGTDKVIEAVHHRSGFIKARVVPVKLAGTVITLAFGGSAGKEGPCAQIGAGLSSIFAGVLRLVDQDRRKLVICGISAGFATVFGTPIAGAVFGIEVLYCGSILYDVLLPSFVSGTIGYQVASALGVQYQYHPVDFVPAFSEAFFIKVALSGVFFGMCAFLLIEAFGRAENISERLSMWKPSKAIIGGAVLVGLTLLVGSRMYLGLGLDTIDGVLKGKAVPWYAFALKIVFTVVTLGFGGSGGVVTPIFFVGATSGSLFGTLAGLDPATFAAIGMAAALAGAANTPIAASIMVVELFGPTIAPYSAIACVVSFLITGHRSVYPAQILAFRKSASVDVPIGEEFEHVEVAIHPRDRSVLGVVLKATSAVESRLAKFHKRPDEDTRE